MEYLAGIRLDHTPLSTIVTDHNKPLKFLMILIEQEDFLDIVKDNQENKRGTKVFI